MPFHAYLGSFHFKLVRNKENLHVESETIDVHDFEQNFGSLSVEKLKAALSVFSLYSQKNSDDCFEHKRNKFSVEFSLDFALFFLGTPWSNNQSQSIFFIWLNLLDFFLQFCEITKASCTISIDH